MIGLRRWHCGTTWIETIRGAVNDVVVRLCYVAGGTRPCHGLMVNAMVIVDRRCSKRDPSHQRGQKNSIEKFCYSRK